MLSFLHGFMSDGGFLMWPLVIAGVVTIASAARRAITRSEGPFDENRMARSLLALSLAYWGLSMAKVAHSPFEMDPRIYMFGFGETLSPVVVGLAIYAFVGMIGSLSRGATAISAPGPV
jgi:hypothetical protein